MIDFGKVLTSAFNSLRNTPKIILPQTINLIPQSLMLLIVSLLGKALLSEYSFTTLMEGITQPILLLNSLLELALPYLIHLTVIAVVSFFLSNLVEAFYPDLARQAKEKKEPKLTAAFEVAKKRFIPLLVTNIMLIIVILAAILIPVSLALSAIAYKSAAAAIPIAIFGGIAFIAILFFALPIGIVLPSVVVLEDKKHLAAIKRAFTLARPQIWSGWLMIILIAVISGVYGAVADGISGAFEAFIGPYASIINSLIMMVLATFILMARTFFYFELETSA